MKCPNCNAEIANTSKFCSKCGTKIEAASRVEESKKEEPKKEEPKKEEPKKEEPKKEETKKEEPKKEEPKKEEPRKEEPRKEEPKAAPQQKAIPPMPSQPWKKEPVPEPVEEKKSKKLPVPVIAVAVVVVLVVAVFALRKPADSGKENAGNAGNAVASLPASSSSQTEQTVASETEQASGQAESQVQTESSQPVADGPKGDPALLNEADEKAVAAQNALNDGDYGDAVAQGTEAIRQYMDIARANHLKEEAQGKIAPVFQVISDAAMTYSERIEEQEMGNAGFNEVRNTVRPVMRLHESLAEEGYSIDVSALETYYDGVIPRFKEYYIRKINEITEREQWSRDEAWTYASQAYAIQDNGTTLLFDEEDLEDPLQMRFVYCRGWIYRKRCETGLADGSMTNEEAFNYMTEVLKETDYNLLVLDDLMVYGKAAGKDVSKYQAAYDAIIAELKDSQGLTIVNNGVNAGTTVDVKKFWYFNDLDGAEEYKVDTVNGTTQETRKWIRENIPEYLK